MLLQKMKRIKCCVRGSKGTHRESAVFDETRRLQVGATAVSSSSSSVTTADAQNAAAEDEAETAEIEANRGNLER